MPINKVAKERPDLYKVERMVMKLIARHMYVNGLSKQRTARLGHLNRASFDTLLKNDTKWASLSLSEFLSLCDGLGLDPFGVLKNAMKKCGIDV